MWLFSKLRKIKLGRYKKKKVRKEKTFKNRTYFVRFTIKVDDPLNPQESDRQYEMMIPAKAAFFAKAKAKRSIQKKIALDFSECEEVTKEQVEGFEKSRTLYEQKLIQEVRDASSNQL